MTGAAAESLGSRALQRAVPTGRHRLHDDANDWPVTNCYIDLWVELLHALGLDPVAGLGGTLALDFVGDQWTFFKYSLDDIHALYGIDVQELALWRPLIEHVEVHLARGEPLIVEVDAWFLPDTAGVTYHVRHDKTSIAIQAVDRPGRRLWYFHNAGFYTLEGGDFDGIFAPSPDESRLVPYVEVVHLHGAVRRPTSELGELALERARRHFARRPCTNPFLRYREQFPGDAAWLGREGLDTFHLYAFAVLRQCGAGFSAGATLLRWLAEHAPGANGPAFVASAGDYETIGRAAKAVQFGLARAVSRRRPADFDASLVEMSERWERATERLAAALP